MNAMFPMLALMVLGSLARADKDEAKYRFMLKKAEDAAVVKQERKRTIFVIKSQSGIGTGSIRLESGQWPTDVVLRFEYTSGRGFQMLGSFILETDRIHVAGSKDCSGKMEFRFVGPDGMIERDKAAGKLDVRVEIRAGAIEVALPANLLTGAKEVRVDWIDAYRN